MARLPRLAVVVLVVVALQGCARRSAAPTLIQTDSGTVAGKVLDSGVKAWLGIPFAQPPVRDLRWKEAQPIVWKGIYNADRKMPACIQVLRPHNINHYFGEEPTGEDCLYLNIWAPSDARSDSRLPVIVFIYGGGGTIGSSAWRTTTASRSRGAARSSSISTTASAFSVSWRIPTDPGAGRPFGQLRLPRSERGVALDSAQHRRVWR